MPSPGSTSRRAPTGRVLKVAHTIADLAASDAILPAHIAEAGAVPPIRKD